VTGVFSRPFLVKTAEEVSVVFFATFGSSLADGQAFGKSALIGASVAGLRAVYGVLVKDVGVPQAPVVK
jgi:hypothetical protein